MWSGDETQHEAVLHGIIYAQVVQKFFFLWGFNGIYKFDGELWTSYTDKDGLLSDTISSLVVSANGCLWVGTNMGVSKFENGTWMNLTTAEGLYNNQIYSLACDQQDNIWIGTRENRLIKYNY